MIKKRKKTSTKKQASAEQISMKIKAKKSFMGDYNEPQSGYGKNSMSDFEDLEKPINNEGRHYKQASEAVNSHHVLNFLEKEIPRIKKLDFLYSQALPNLHQQAVLDRSILKQELYKEELKTNVLQIISHDESYFYNFLKVLFENFFPPQEKGH